MESESIISSLGTYFFGYPCCKTTEGQWPKGKISKVFFFRERADYAAFAAACDPDNDTGDSLGFYAPEMRSLQLYNMGDKPIAGGMGEDTISTFWPEPSFRSRPRRCTCGSTRCI